MSFSDPSDLDQDGISGKINALTDLETGETRLGRFGYKASKARLAHHIASALNTDMGITTSLYPTIDHKNTSSSQEINDEDFTLNISRYVIPTSDNKISPFNEVKHEFEKNIKEVKHAEDELKKLLIEDKWI